MNKVVFFEYVQGAKKEVVNCFNKFFSDRFMEPPAEEAIKHGRNKFQVSLPVKIAEWIGVVFNNQIPDLLVGQEKETGIVGQGKVSFMSPDAKLTSLARAPRKSQDKDRVMA
jgi:hypothetical protein